MSGSFRDIDVKQLTDNPFKLIGDDWMLVTAGEIGDFNMMTASWGGLGVMWNRNIAFCMVRPSRHTYEFIERANRFTLSFFGEEHREMLNFCGTHSGRDVDKVEETGLNPIGDAEAAWFEDARLVLICRKLYGDNVREGSFCDYSTVEFYPKDDYHRIYFGEVERCLVKG